MKVTIIGTTTCPYCVNAKTLAKERNLTVESFTIVKDPAEYNETNISMEKAFEMVGQSFRTVPPILVDGKHIGGFDDFSKYVNTHVDTKDFDDMEL